jgi:hypothetical protein
MSEGATGLSSQFDDLLGGDALAEPVRNRGGRPTNEERARRAEQALADAAHQAELRQAVTGRTKVSEEEFLLPVSRNFLGRVLHMDPMTVKKRLRGCKPAATFGGGSGREVYYFHEALPFLVKPKMDIATYLKTLNPTDMPASVNKTFWEAERIKNKVLIETGEAWHDGAVLDVLGRVFMLMKERIPIITEGMREAGLTDEQSAKLAEFADQMQKDLYEALVEQPKLYRTQPRRAELEIYDGPEIGVADFEEEADDA